jgi:hypothetical protein
MGTTHGPVPVQPPPDQPKNIDPGAGVANNVTGTPCPTVTEQLPGHEIPAGSLVTLPEPLPTTVVLIV